MMDLHAVVMTPNARQVTGRYSAPVHQPVIPFFRGGLSMGLRELIDLIVRDVAELPGRSSPDDWPEAMLVTNSELRDILFSRLDGRLSVPSSQSEKLVTCGACGRKIDPDEDSAATCAAVNRCEECMRPQDWEEYNAVDRSTAVSVPCSVPG